MGSQELSFFQKTFRYQCKLIRLNPGGLTENHYDLADLPGILYNDVNHDVVNVNKTGILTYFQHKYVNQLSLTSIVSQIPLADRPRTGGSTQNRRIALGTSRENAPDRADYRGFRAAMRSRARAAATLFARFVRISSRAID